METKVLITKLQKTFNVKNFIDVSERPNGINITIDKHLDKTSINTKTFSIHCEKSGNNRNAKTNLFIELKVEPSIDVTLNIMRELTLYIHNKFISLDDCKRQLDKRLK